jgi:hypothetical protein
MYDEYFGVRKLDATAVPYLKGDNFPVEAEKMIEMLNEADKKREKFSTEKEDLLMVKLRKRYHPMKGDFIVAFLNWSGAKKGDMVIPKKIENARKLAAKEDCYLNGSKIDRILFDSLLKNDQLIDDKEVDLDCEVMNVREDFLAFCRENRYQFNEIRRAKHSSSAFVHRAVTSLRNTAPTTVSLTQPVSLRGNDELPFVESIAADGETQKGSEQISIPEAAILKKAKGDTEGGLQDVSRPCHVGELLRSVEDFDNTNLQKRFFDDNHIYAELSTTITIAPESLESPTAGNGKKWRDGESLGSMADDDKRSSVGDIPNQDSALRLGNGDTVGSSSRSQLVRKQLDRPKGSSPVPSPERKADPPGRKASVIVTGNRNSKSQLVRKQSDRPKGSSPVPSPERKADPPGRKSSDVVTGNRNSLSAPSGSPLELTRSFIEPSKLPKKAAVATEKEIIPDDVHVATDIRGLLREAPLEERLRTANQEAVSSAASQTLRHVPHAIRREELRGHAALSATEKGTIIVSGQSQLKDTSIAEQRHAEPGKDEPVFDESSQAGAKAAEDDWVDIGGPCGAFFDDGNTEAIKDSCSRVSADVEESSPEEKASDGDKEGSSGGILVSDRAGQPESNGSILAKTLSLASLLADRLLKKKHSSKDLIKNAAFLASDHSVRELGPALLIAIAFSKFRVEKGTTTEFLTAFRERVSKEKQSYLTAKGRGSTELSREYRKKFMLQDTALETQRQGEWRTKAVKIVDDIKTELEKSWQKAMNPVKFEEVVQEAFSRAELGEEANWAKLGNTLANHVWAVHMLSNQVDTTLADKPKNGLLVDMLELVSRVMDHVLKKKHDKKVLIRGEAFVQSEDQAVKFGPALLLAHAFPKHARDFEMDGTVLEFLGSFRARISEEGKNFLKRDLRAGKGSTKLGQEYTDRLKLKNPDEENVRHDGWLSRANEIVKQIENAVQIAVGRTNREDLKATFTEIVDQAFSAADLGERENWTKLATAFATHLWAIDLSNMSTQKKAPVLNIQALDGVFDDPTNDEQKYTCSHCLQEKQCMSLQNRHYAKISYRNACDQPIIDAHLRSALSSKLEGRPPTADEALLITVIRDNLRKTTQNAKRGNKTEDFVKAICQQIEKGNNRGFREFIQLYMDRDENGKPTYTWENSFKKSVDVMLEERRKERMQDAANKAAKAKEAARKAGRSRMTSNETDEPRCTPAGRSPGKNIGE